MPTWGEILAELHATTQVLGTPDFDGVRRKYLSQLHALTNRDTIIYYTDWLTTNNQATIITLEDMQAMMEVCKDLRGDGLDLVIHSPGGQAEAVASVVNYLRQKYDDIRVFVPLAAMSAGTMWALSADQIVMGKHSQLGPIDPQIFNGQRHAPSRAIVGQFNRAIQEIKDDPASLQAWFPILQQYGVSLLEECEAAEQLGKRLVKNWLSTYMFRAEAAPAIHAEAVTEYFSNFDNHQSHGLGITRALAQAQGLAIVELESDQQLQDAVLSVHHATMHTLGGPAVKIVENHLNRAYVKLSQSMQVPQVQFVPVPGQPQPPGS